MPVILVHHGPTLTQERYEAAVQRVTGGKRRLDASTDWPVAGLLVHAAGQGSTGFRVVDVWESAEAAAAFWQIVMPILAEIGVTDLPEIYPAHTLVSA